MSEAKPVAGIPDAPKRGVLLVFVGLMVTELLASLDSTVFTTALPTIVGQLHGVDQQQWVLTAYLLTSTISLPIYGKIGDLIGRKGLFLAAIGIFVVGSTVSGFAGDMTWLVIGRAVQGLGGGGLMILSDTIVADVVPARSRGRYMGLIGAVMVLASIAGPLVGGWFTDGPGWRWGLWINIPLGILAFIAAAVFMHLPKVDARKLRLDWAGMGLLTIALTCLVLVTTWGGVSYAWGSAQILSLIVVAVSAGVLFVLVERRAAEPVMPLTLFKDRNFNLTTIGGLVIAVAMFSVDGYLPTYLQMVTGVTAIQSGLLMLPMLIALMAASIVSGELVTRTGRYKWLPITGAAIVAASLFLLSTMTPTTPIWVICTSIGLMGVGLGASLQILVLVVQNSFPMSMVGVATATNNYFRQVGAAVGAAVFGSLFTARLTGLLTDQPPAGISGGADSLTPQLVRSLPTPVRDLVVRIYSQALAPLFLFLMPVVVITAVLLFFVIEKPLATTLAPASTQAPERTTTMNVNSRSSLEQKQPVNDARPETLAPDARWPSQRRTAGALLIAGPVIFLLAEFIAAAAWTDPPYSYTYDFISNLGVHGPSTLFGQYMYSPLAWVMNTGFFLIGITVLAGVAALRGLSGWRRWAVLVAATLLAVGGVLLALFHGSNEALKDGTGDFHALGATAGFIGGNVLAILLGSMHRRIGLSAKLGRALVTVGVIGLLSMVAYFADLLSEANVLIGLVERGAVHPFLIGLICAGASIWNRRSLDVSHP